MFAFFFFSSRDRHTIFWRAWISVLSSPDLATPLPKPPRHPHVKSALPPADHASEMGYVWSNGGRGPADRKSVGEGKSVDIGGGRIIKKKKTEEIGEVTERIVRCTAYHQIYI